MRQKQTKIINNKQVQSYFLMGDQGISKSYFFKIFQIEEEEMNQQINVYVQPTSADLSIQFYDFPTDKTLRVALQMYLNILEGPNLVLYFLNSESNNRDLRQWIKLIRARKPQAKLLFISDVNTYAQRQKILTRLGPQFDTSIIQHVCFVNLQPHALDRALKREVNVGVNLSTAICLQPTFSQRFLKYWRKMFKKIKQKKAESVV